MKLKHNPIAGFTLVELLVSLGIIVIITGIARFGKTRFERSILLTNLGYDVALAIREAQVYGVNVKRTSNTTLTNPYDVSYGVHFQSGSDTFTLFVDNNNDHFYNTSGTPADSAVRTYTIKNNNKIAGLCVVRPGDTAGTCHVATSLDITFRRPDPNACLNSSGAQVLKSGGAIAVSTGECNAVTTNTNAQIRIQATDSSRSAIRVSSIGQIYVTSSLLTEL